MASYLDRIKGREGKELKKGKERKGKERERKKGRERKGKEGEEGERMGWVVLFALIFLV